MQCLSGLDFENTKLPTGELLPRRGTVRRRGFLLCFTRTICLTQNGVMPISEHFFTLYPSDFHTYTDNDISNAGLDMRMKEISHIVSEKVCSMFLSQHHRCPRVMSPIATRHFLTVKHFP